MQNFKYLMRQKLAPQLIALRKEKGLSLQDVALQTPLTMNMITLMEQGGNLSFHHYLRLLRFYGKKLEFNLTDIK